MYRGIISVQRLTRRIIHHSYQYQWWGPKPTLFSAPARSPTHELFSLPPRGPNPILFSLPPRVRNLYYFCNQLYHSRSQRRTQKHNFCWEILERKKLECLVREHADQRVAPLHLHIYDRTSFQHPGNRGVMSRFKEEETRCMQKLWKKDLSCLFSGCARNCRKVLDVCSLVA